MDIILVSNVRGKLGRIKLNWHVLLIGMLVIGVSGSGLLMYGYRAGAEHVAEQIVNNPDAATQLWHREILQQRNLVTDGQTRLDSHLDALALRAGRLQAHVARIDALGGRLATMANLAANEFDFHEDPGLGGPAQNSTPSSTAVHDVADALVKLSEELQDREEKLVAMETLLMNRKLQDSLQPGGRPITKGWMSSGFGARADPVTGKREFHRGVDFAGKRGSEVVVVAAGVVSWSGRRSSYGNMVEVNHGNGYVTRYSHNQENLVAVGDKVDKGQAIALMGSTGRSTGPHVHFEVIRNGKLVNPVKYTKSAAK